MTLYRHIPVLLHESVDLLVTDPRGIYVDATLGLGGHSEVILKHISSSGRVIGFDVDPDAIAIAQKRLENFNNFQFIRNNFKQIKIELTRMNLLPINGVLFDLGLSSLEIDNGEKGFSFINDGPLDMRMDPSLPQTASDIINHESREELRRIIRDFGEERHAGAIANRIVKIRNQKPYQHTSDLAETVRETIHGPFQIKSLARVFQAFRIAVNHELEALKRGLIDAFDCLAPNGRLVVISYHSLEDRIVKTFFRDLYTGCICPPEQAVCTCSNRIQAEPVVKKFLEPAQAEQDANPRSRSARLRCLRKL